jgi:hypothetical protein
MMQLVSFSDQSWVFELPKLLRFCEQQVVSGGPFKDLNAGIRFNHDGTARLTRSRRY